MFQTKFWGKSGLCSSSSLYTSLFCYGNHSKLFIHLFPGNCANSFHQLKACLNDIHNGMFVMDVVCNVSVLFDSKSSFTNLVNSVIKSCFANLCDLHHIQHFLSYDVLVLVANALVSSCLDYCNSLFCILSSKNISRFQNIHNCLALCFLIFSCHSNLIHKYLITGRPKYFALYLSLYISSNPEKMFLKVPFYSSSVYKSKVHFNKYFSYTMLQNSEMICHWKFELLLHFCISKVDLKLICFRNHSSLGLLTTEHQWSLW